MLRIVTVLLLLSFVACRKGREDPAFTLLSRKARMDGNWKLQEGRVTIRANGPDQDELDFKLTRGALALTVTASNSSTVYTGDYSLDLNLDRKGSFDFKETLGSKTLEGKGSWSFNSGAGNLKRKADVFFLTTWTAGSSSSGYHLFNKSSANFDYHLRQLSNRKMVMETSSYVYLDASGIYQGVEAELIFTQ